MQRSKHTCESAQARTHVRRHARKWNMHTIHAHANRHTGVSRRRCEHTAHAHTHAHTRTLTHAPMHTLAATSQSTLMLLKPHSSHIRLCHTSEDHIAHTTPHRSWDHMRVCVGQGERERLARRAKTERERRGSEKRGEADGVRNVTTRRRGRTYPGRVVADGAARHRQASGPIAEHASSTL